MGLAAAAHSDSVQTLLVYIFSGAAIGLSLALLLGRRR